MKRISVVEDNRFARDSVKEMLNQIPGISCLAAYPNAEAALDCIDQEVPDLLLLDLGLPRMTGLECAEQLLNRFPDLRIVALTRHDEPEYVKQAAKIGVFGYLTKPVERRELEKQIFSAISGKSPLSDHINTTVLNLLRAELNPQEPNKSFRLSRREQEIVKLLVVGLQDKMIAQRLGISEQTVNSHTKNIFQKMKVHSRAEAVARWNGNASELGA